MFDQAEAACAIRLADTLYFPLHEYRCKCPILAKLMFPPSDSEIAAKGLAVIEVSADDRRFEV